MEVNKILFCESGSPLLLFGTEMEEISVTVWITIKPRRNSQTKIISGNTQKGN